MKLKTIEVNGATYAAVQDGKPVYVDEAGKEIAFDAPHTIGTITRLNGEAKAHREAKEAAFGLLKAFEGIEDAEAARKAMETVRNLDQGQLVTAGKVQEIRDAAAKAAREQVEAAAKASAEQIQKLEGERNGLQSALYEEKIGGSFGRSKFVAEKVAIPPTFLQAQFGKHFAVEGGKIIAKDHAGNPIYSRAKPGEVADFDEALEHLIAADPYRDSILKGTNSSGSGARPSNGSGGARTYTRAEFSKLPPEQQSATMAAVRKGEASLVD